MKRIIAITLLASSLLCNQTLFTDTKDTHEIFLTSEMVHFLDGKPFGINAAVVKRMLQVRRETKKLQYGHGEKGEGHYRFNNGTYTIHGLALLESTYEMEFYQQESKYITDKRTYCQELSELEAVYKETKHKLKDVLARCRHDFEEKITPFIKIVRGAKDQMIVLLLESCQKHNRPDSFLLKWVESPDNGELQYFHEQITSFKALDQLCSDFVNFMDDIMRSCPKAMAQFKKLMEEQHAQTNGRK